MISHCRSGRPGAIVVHAVTRHPRRIACRGWRWRMWMVLVLTLLCRGAFATTPLTNPWAPFHTPWFDTISVASGLPHPTTTAIAQDSRGVMWIGTMGGLVRYDGYRMQIFGNATPEVEGLPDTYVRNLLALPDGDVLIGTNAGGLVRFEAATNAFQAYPVGADGTADARIYGMADDHAGGVWIATENGLDHLDLASNKVTHVTTGPQADRRHFCVLQDRAGNLWLGNSRGLFVRRTGTTTFVRPLGGAIATAVLTDQIWALQEDHAGRLWVGSVQNGTVYRDRDGQWRGVPGFGPGPGASPQATVRDFLELASGAMWIATDGRGIVEYTPGSTAAKVLTNDPALASSLPGTRVRALLQDRAENVWVATEQGIARANPNPATAFSLLSSPLDPRGLADARVEAILVDSRQRIWLGLSGGHIDLIDLPGGRIRHLQLGGDQARADVQALSETEDGAIWAGSNGVTRIDPVSLKMRSGMVPAVDRQPVISLYRDGANMFIGTYDGVFRHDLRSGKTIHFKHNPRDPTSLANNTVRQTARVGDELWYATTRGISVARDALATTGFQHLAHRPGDRTSLPQDYISAISTTASGQVWVGTYRGLAWLEPHVAGEPYRFRSIGLADGLVNDKVNALLEDARGGLWASLSNGLAQIDPVTRKVHNLGTRDGLHVLSYVHTSAARAPGGELMFGGLGGLTVIRPLLQPSSVPPAPLAVTQTIVNGRVLPYADLPREGTRLVLAPRERSVRVDFALLDYEAPMETSYSYRLDDLDERWTEIPHGSMPAAIYTNLPHGTHRLRLHAVAHGMRERTIETEFSIQVQPLWYETWWARLLTIAVALGMLVALVHLRTLYLRRQARQLQTQIDAHTCELRAANHRLDELAGKDGLTGVYNRRRFLELAAAELGDTQQRPISMALLDLDRFKRINDTYGHLAGDAVIRNTVDLIVQHSRARDLVGRYGGEEFVLCLPDTALAAALEIAERICVTLAGNTVHCQEGAVAVTVSIGVAQWHAGESVEEWLSRADQALYEAKRRGRNCCAAAP